MIYSIVVATFIFLIHSPKRVRVYVKYSRGIIFSNHVILQNSKSNIEIYFVFFFFIHSSGVFANTRNAKLKEPCVCHWMRMWLRPPYTRAIVERNYLACLPAYSFDTRPNTTVPRTHKSQNSLEIRTSKSDTKHGLCIGGALAIRSGPVCVTHNHHMI